MRRASIALTSALALAAGVALSAQTPAFRSRIDVIALDVSVVDARGRPVEDLSIGDFAVEIEGQTRNVVSAESIGPDEGAEPARQAGILASIDAFYSTNQAPATGRRIVLAVDQSHLDATLARPVMRAATRLLDRLSPLDQVALITFPGTGPRLDFTDDHGLVRRELQRVVGQRLGAREYRFSMGISEALDIEARERPRAVTSTATGPATEQPGIAAVMERDCDATDANGRDQCRRQILNEASTRVAELWAVADRSVDELEALVGGLASVDGPKSLVLLSSSLAIRDHRELETVAWRAGTGRTAVHVVAIDSEGSGEVGTPPESVLADRRVRFDGLEELARQTRGTYSRIVGTGEEIFEHLATTLSSSYIVGVEALPEDLARDRLRVSVTVLRPGVSIRTSPAFAAPPVPNDSRSVTAALGRALESPFGTPGLPVRVTTFALRDPESGRTRVTVAGQVGRPGEPDREFTVGLLVVNAAREVLMRTADRQSLRGTDGDARLPYTSAMLLDPGVYSVRFGAVDDEGRLGSVVREVRVPEPVDGTLDASDLLLGALPRAGEALAPRVEPLVGTVGVAGYLEIYAPGADTLARTRVALEIANSAEGPALATQAAVMRPGPRAGWAVASGSVDVRTLVPGRYVLRAVVTHDGGTLVRIRPFVFEGIGFTVVSR